MAVARSLLFLLLSSLFGCAIVDAFANQGVELRRAQSQRLPLITTQILVSRDDERNFSRLLTQQMMTRRGGKERVESFSPTITYLLMAFNSIMFMLTSRDPWLKQRWMKIDSSIAYGDKYRLLSAIFVHGNFPHVLSNSMSLYNIGPILEKQLGSFKFFFLYIASGVLANIGTYFLQSSPYSLGASGSTFGVLGALAAFCLVNKKVLGAYADSMLSNIGQNILYNIVLNGAMRNIDHWAHIGGFLSGAFLSFFLSPRYGKRRTDF